VRTEEFVVAFPLLVVTAVPAEAEAVRAGVDRRHVAVHAVGVGPAAAAAGTARLLATGSYRAVISAGIAGGFVGRAPVGAVVIGARSIAADLGAETSKGFRTVEELGFGASVVAADAALLGGLVAALPQAIVGDVLTLSTVTGTAATAERLAAGFPTAVAEAMEGFGVACAAQIGAACPAEIGVACPAEIGVACAAESSAAKGLPFAELRAISNPIGPRDRAAWQLEEAFAALSTASGALWTACG
jgi:futalosine hydrolase